jgi:hypothetical protein
VLSTGDRCVTTGNYASDCGAQWTVSLNIGDNFPPCPHCHRAVRYRFVGLAPSWNAR